MTTELSPLEKSIQEDMEALKALAQPEDEKPEQEKEEADEELQDTEEQEGDDVEEDSAESTEAAPEEKIEEKPDNAAFAKMRRELKEKEQRLAEMEKQLTMPKPEAQAETDVDEYLRMAAEREMYNAARRSFIGFEDQVKGVVEDYDAVASQYAQAVTQSILIQNPRLNTTQAWEQAERYLLERAGQYLQQGKNPAFEIYKDAVKLGFKAQPVAEQEPVKEKPAAPDLDKIAANKKRSSSMVAVKGGAKPTKTLESLINAPLSELSKLSREEIEALARQ